jgi:murein L,D-transpeptidase YafK
MKLRRFAPWVLTVLVAGAFAGWRFSHVPDVATSKKINPGMTETIVARMEEVVATVVVEAEEAEHVAEPALDYTFGDKILEQQLGNDLLLGYGDVMHAPPPPPEPVVEMAKVSLPPAVKKTEEQIRVAPPKPETKAQPKRVVKKVAKKPKKVVKKKERKKKNEKKLEQKKEKKREQGKEKREKKKAEKKVKKTTELAKVSLSLPPKARKNKRKLTAIERRSDRIERKILKNSIAKLLKRKKLRRGMPIFIRVFKQSHELEVWMKKGSRYRHLKTYPICYWSGQLGPKIYMGDRQSPEGFYSVSLRQLRPRSKYYKGFNLGFPNSYDRAHSRTGRHLMIHGECQSDGCYAMTNAGIHEIYTLAEAALRKGQRKFAVHVFPFRMTKAAMQHHRTNKWHEFWEDLKTGYDWFEQHRVPPRVSVISGEYRIKGAS